LVETINTGTKHCLNTTVSHNRLCLIKKTIDPAEEILLIFLGLSVHPSPSSRRHLHSILQISIIHHTKRQLKNFDKRGKLISTLTRTFYEASAAEEEDQRRRRGRSNSAEDGVVDIRWPLSPSRTRPAGLLQRQLFEEKN
jgi:hypothetical protein